MVELRQVVTRTRGEAEKVLERLNQGSDMGDEARKNSIAPEAGDGGNLGWIEKGELEESVDEIIFSLPTGKFSPIVKSPYGFHIFEVLSRRGEGLKDLHEVMAEIESKLISQKRESVYKKWIEELKASIPISIEEGFLKKWGMEGQTG